MRYTQLGNGDFDPPEYPEVETCQHCGKPAIDEYDYGYCGFKHWFLCNIGTVKKQIIEWQAQGLDVLNLLVRGGWFENMTPSTAERYRRAVKNLVEDEKIIKQSDDYRDQGVWQGKNW